MANQEYPNLEGLATGFQNVAFAGEGSRGLDMSDLLGLIVLHAVRTDHEPFQEKAVLKAMFTRRTADDPTEYLFCLHLIIQYEHTQTLDFDNPALGSAFFPLICDIVKRGDQHLQILILEKVMISEGLVTDLFSALDCNPNLTRLEFSQCKFLNRGFSDLLRRLSKNKTIKELRMENYEDPPITAFQSKLFCDLLHNNITLKVLNLSHCNIGDIRLSYLLAGLCSLKTNTGICSLVLCGNNLTVECAQMISTILRYNKSLRLLDLENNCLTDEVLEAMIPALKMNNTLEYLGLRCTNITDIGMKHLWEALKDNRTLRYINLSRNPGIQEMGINYLYRALDYCSVAWIHIDAANPFSPNQAKYAEMAADLLTKSSFNINKRVHIPSEDDAFVYNNNLVCTQCFNRELAGNTDTP